MPISRRILPVPVKIKDYRDSGGTYYEAECDQCGRKYYPKRNTAKYCSKLCADQAAMGYTNGGDIDNHHKESKKVASTSIVPDPRQKVAALIDKIKAPGTKKKETAAGKSKRVHKEALEIIKKYKPGDKVL